MDAVTSYVTVISDEVLLINCCAPIVLVPLVETPVIPAGWIAVQLYVTPLVVLLKVTTNEVSPEHMV